jgi:hypothetical protein
VATEQLCSIVSPQSELRDPVCHTRGEAWNRGM